MPKETDCKVEYSYDDMKEVTEDHERDHQTNGDPNP
jgi:hypothetical protein